VRTTGNTGSARFRRKGGDTKVKFPVVRLDDITPSAVALVKIDVEGMKAEVVRSAPKLLHRDRPIVVFETDTRRDVRKVVSELAGLDYAFLVNLRQRGGQEDIYEAGRLPSLSSQSLASRFVLPLPLLDVVAIPNDSSRWPAHVRSTLFTSSVTARKGRLKFGKLRLSYRSRLAGGYPASVLGQRGGR
jgi:hypothetical protein